MCDWLAERQITDTSGRLGDQRPRSRARRLGLPVPQRLLPRRRRHRRRRLLLHRVDAERYAEQIRRAATWIEGMQSSNGGWGAFDIDNNADFLNSIPFADHGALLDPPTADVSARCMSFLAQIGYGRDHPAIARGLDFLKSEQEPDGSWFGRWGTNYVYGTWSVLCALNAAGEDMQAPYVRRAVDWLLSRQRDDGGWGEDGATYWSDRRSEAKASTASQTVLGAARTDGGGREPTTRRPSAACAI
jgi:squalene-hopene/tetraprenyl-beta-curcumene cyclase